MIRYLRISERRIEVELPVSLIDEVRSLAAIDLGAESAGVLPERRDLVNGVLRASERRKKIGTADDDVSRGPLELGFFAML